MATRKHKPTEAASSARGHGHNLHEAAVAMGHAGGKVGGPARANKLSQAERTKIATQGGQARGRQEGSTSAHGQVTRKAAMPAQPPARPTMPPQDIQPGQGPPRQQRGGLSGPQPIHGAPRGPNPPVIAQTAGGRAGFGAAGTPDVVDTIAANLLVPRRRNQPAMPLAPVEPVRSSFDQAVAAMGRGGGKRIG